MSLEATVDELNKIMELAKKEPGAFAPAVRAGWTGKIMKARDDLDALQRKYSKALFDHAFGFFLRGNAEVVDQACKSLVGMGEGLAVDSQELYKRIAKKVEPLLGKRREWVSDCTAKVHAEFKAIMNELDVRAANLPDAKHYKTVCRTHEDVVRYVKAMVVDSNSYDFPSLYLQKQIRELGLKVKYRGDTVPIFIAGASDEEVVAYGTLFKQGKINYTVPEECADGLDLIKTIWKAGIEKGGKGKKSKAPPTPAL